MDYPMSKRKPHDDFAGYVAELRNKYSGGHTIISDCKRAAEGGNALVLDYVLEGGRYQVLCNEHGHLIYSPSLPTARELMKDPASFCMLCRVLAGDCSIENAGLADFEIEKLKGSSEQTSNYRSQSFNKNPHENGPGRALKTKGPE